MKSSSASTRSARRAGSEIRVVKVLSTEQVAAYRCDGYLVVPNFVSTAKCVELRAHALVLAERLAAECPHPTIFTADGTAQHAAEAWFLESGDRMRCFFERDAFLPDGTLRAAPHLCLNKLGHAMHDLDPVFESFSRTPELAAVADEIGMRDPRLLQSMYIFKQAHIGGEVQSHIDHTYLRTEPRSVVGFWFALDDATIENGCMWAQPGAHRGELGADFVPLEAARGTLVLLDGALPHRSGANTSDKPRHAYTLHAIEGWTYYPPDNWLKRPIADLRGFAR